MILRKPYALLIKHFQKIHLVLILLCAYIFYKLTMLRTFVADFLETESYDSYYEPISNHINILVILAIIAVLAIVVVLVVLLRYKKKPWKIYILPFVEYLFMLVVLLFVKSYFDNFDEMESVITTIMAGRDLLTIAYYPQFIVFIIFGIRFLGIDLNKFGFKNDEEYLDIKEEDREEVEISFELDKDRIVRNIKKFFRHVRYVYLEHKLVCNTIIVIIFVSITGYTYYYFGILHRTYSEGNTFNANYYAITINNSYLTDYDSNGNNITEGKNYSYLVVNVTVKNLASKRSINIDRFRVMNRNNQFRNVSREYDNFADLSKPFDRTKELATGEEVTFILVYKVDKDLNPKKYVLYYPDVSKGVLLKKIKLSVKDVRELENIKEVSLNQNMEFPTKDTLTVTNFKVVDSTTYSRYTCTNSCGIREQTLTAVGNNKILEIAFVSNNFTGQSFIDFSNLYATINYKNNSGETFNIAASSVIDNYSGNYAYFSIPSDVDPNSIELVFTFRDGKYVYKLS